MLFFSIAHLANTRKWKNTIVHSEYFMHVSKASSVYNIAYQNE